MSDITLMLEAASAGDGQASEQLLPLVYEELRRLAAARDRDHSPALRGIPAEYLGRLIRNCLSEIPADPLTAAPAATAGIVEPLTAREREVLRLLAAGRANREIASDLVVTLDTVKKHVGHICRKLGAANRTQAVAHARELGLVR